MQKGNQCGTPKSTKNSQLAGSSAEPQRTQKQLTQHHRARDYCEDQAINQLWGRSLKIAIHLTTLD